PANIHSREGAATQIRLATPNMANPKYTIGFLPKLSDKGPNTNSPIPNPKNIMVISFWFSVGSKLLMERPMVDIAGKMASMAKATIDIKDAIMAMNSNWGRCCDFCILQK